MNKFLKNANFDHREESILMVIALVIPFAILPSMIF
jgi:hypothetical protein